jgi:hypothetical protein
MSQVLAVVQGTGRSGERQPVARGPNQRRGRRASASSGHGGAEAGVFERGVPVLRGLAKGDPQAGVW